MTDSSGAQGLSEAEQRVRKGVDLYKRLRISLAAAAQASGAPRETIRRRAQGQSSREEQHRTAGQRLNDAEEAALVHFIVKMEASGFPMRRIDVEGAAMSLIMARESDPVPLGHCWFSRFINRHAKLLAFRTKATLDRQRTRGLTEENARRFFSLLSYVVEEYKLGPEAIFSMDETGVQRGVASASFKYAVSVAPRKNTVAARKDGSQELTTVIEAISAAGSMLPPVYVFKGKLVDLSLGLDDSQGAFITSSESGWTNTGITSQWFKTVFLPESRKMMGVSAQAAAPHRLLIMDGHSSHFTLPMLELAVRENVHVLALPAHTTHGLAPLDRACFGPLKQAWAEEQRVEMFLTGVVRKEDFVRLYQAARIKALTVSNIQKGYSATGIWPLRGLSAIPSSMLTAPELSDKEMEEARESVWMSDDLAESLFDLSDRQRSLVARSALIQAARCLREATATDILFNDLTHRLRQHAAGLKAKPRAFRVAQDGQARLFTAEESMAIMKAAEEAHAEEARLREERANEAQRRREEKEREEQRKKEERERLKAARQQKKIEEEAAKQARKEAKEKRRAEREAEAQAKALRKKQKIAHILALSNNFADAANSTSTSNCPPLQPTQLPNNLS